MDAHGTVTGLMEADEDRAQRQLGVVDWQGGTATSTGEACLEWAGGRTGLGYACQANIATGPEVVEAMAASFESNEGTLARRLLAALAAGDAAGGDRRGRQSAALLVVRTGGGYAGGSDIAVDLRVDDHEDPMLEMDRLMGVHELYFPNPATLEWVAIEGSLPATIRRALTARDLDTGAGRGYSDDLRNALRTWVGMENLEHRWSDEAKIDKTVLELLLQTE
jgi:uncharacterized Ntn-hydrolase superfamily protein